MADRHGRNPQRGYITGYRAIVDGRKLGFALMALVHITLDRHTPERFANFDAKIREIGRAHV